MSGPKRRRVTSQDRTNPIAQRIQAWCEQNNESLRSLSERAGRHPSTAQKTIENLEAGLGFGVDVLLDLSRAMGVTLDSLLYGRDVPVLLEARSLPGWDDAVADARRMVDYTDEEIAGAGLIGVPTMRAVVNAILVEACVRVWRATSGGGQRTS